MSAEELLKANERSALGGGEIISNVSGKNTKIKSGKALKSFGAMGFITLMIVIFLVFFSSGTLIPAGIAERLVEETDVQYADAVQSKMIVFQQALKNGSVPEDTATILKNNGVLVGYVEENSFVETNENNGGLALKMDEQIITSDEFVAKANTEPKLYKAFNEATYQRAGYYYDESAMEVFKKIGTNRNNYSADSDFDEVMSSVMGEGSNIDINSVSVTEETETDPDTGQSKTVYKYTENGGSANSKEETTNFINAVADKNTADDTTKATLNSASALNNADTIAKEQRSSLFYLALMENISKMKAGDGNDSKINEAMNYLYESAETEVVDVNTGEVVKVTGSALDSPSLYAILAGEKASAESVENYSSDRVLKTVENKLGADGASSDSISSTVSSSSPKVNGSIGRLISSGAQTASNAILELVNPTLSQSLVDNSFENIKGVGAGEFLVEGAVNVGKELAKASGGTPGDAEAVAKYNRLNSKVLAMDAEVDRMNRSPFDITSRNTFLGSIVYSMAVSLRSTSGVVSHASVVLKTTSSSLASLMSSTYADEADGYLSVHGDCETYNTIGAVGSVGCTEIATFDTSTLNDPFNDDGFNDFVEANTTLNSSGSRVINQDSKLAEFIKNNDERLTPLGVMDGGILSSSSNDLSIPFISDIAEMVKSFMGASDYEKRMASGAAFVNSSSNPDWDIFKYAQRYVSLARATSALKQYSKDKTAYNNIPYFEGEKNPVAVFLEEYYATK